MRELRWFHVLEWSVTSLCLRPKLVTAVCLENRCASSNFAGFSNTWPQTTRVPPMVSTPPNNAMFDPPSGLINRAIDIQIITPLSRTRTGGRAQGLSFARRSIYMSDAEAS